MGFYPQKFSWEQFAQSDVPGTEVEVHPLVEVALGSPVVDDVDKIVTSTNMKVGAYTIAAQPDVPRNITVTHTAVDAADTLGTITVVGTDAAGNAISETLTPSSGTTVAGSKAFKTVTSVTGAGWVIGGGNDTITIGVGGKIGLPLKLKVALVIAAVLNGTREATLPTLTVSDSVLASNTIDFNSAWAGTAAVVYLLV